MTTGSAAGAVWLAGACAVLLPRSGPAPVSAAPTVAALRDAENANALRVCVSLRVAALPAAACCAPPTSAYSGTGPCM